MFVFFDDCWFDSARLGRQPDPTPGIHNSGWLQSPGAQIVQKPSEWARLEDYVTDIVSTFSNDERVVIWDVYNEPGNNFLVSLHQPAIVRTAKLLANLFAHKVLPMATEALLAKAFSWVRAADPEQPLTCGLYYLLPGMPARLNALAWL